jgi:ubiquinone/menaquinone biosynthesis C-methylase UbiE
VTEDNTGRIRKERSASFGSVAAEYERARPGYPPEAVRWLAGDHAAGVLDVAAGTGKLTTALDDAGHRVVALEPSVEMLHQLKGQRGEIPVAAGRAEVLPFGAETFDLITVAQAFHWFDQPTAVAEFARVLRPGGHLALLWNFRDESVGWVTELSKLIGTEGAQKEEDLYEPLASSRRFAPSTHRGFTFEQPLDRELLVGLVRSRSYVATLSEEERNLVLDEVRRLCDEHPTLAGRAEFSMPYRTEVFRAEKID